MKKGGNIKNLLRVYCFIHFHYSQKSMKHTGKRRGSYSTRNTKTDVVVKHLLWWTSKRTVDVKPGQCNMDKNILNRTNIHIDIYSFLPGPNTHRQGEMSVCVCVWADIDPVKHTNFSQLISTTAAQTLVSSNSHTKHIKQLNRHMVRQNHMLLK